MTKLLPAVLLIVVVVGCALKLSAQRREEGGEERKQEADPRPAAKTLSDAVEEAQTPRTVRQERAEQAPSDHDKARIFAAEQAVASSRAFKNQPDAGKVNGFDFYRDPLNAERPKQTFEEICKPT